MGLLKFNCDLAKIESILVTFIGFHFTFSVCPSVILVAALFFGEMLSVHVSLLTDIEVLLYDPSPAVKD